MDDPNAGREDAIAIRQPGHPNLVRGGGSRIQVKYPHLRVKPSEIRDLATQHLLNSEYIKRLGAVAAGAARIVAYAGKGKTVNRPPTWKEMDQAGDRLVKLATAGRLHVVMENGDFALGMTVIALKYISPDMHSAFDAEVQAFCKTFVAEQNAEQAERFKEMIAENEFEYGSMYFGTDTVNDSGTGEQGEDQSSE